MRYFGISAAVASLVVLAACGGSEKKADTDSTNTAMTTDTNSAQNSAPAGAATAAPITGTTHEVKLMVDAKGMYTFDPAAITIKAGDGIKYVNVSGGPHNIAFDPAQFPADVRAQLAANMPNTPTELSSPMLVQPNETYTVSFGNIKPGTYTAHCTPHLAMNMKQVITVQ